MNRDEALNKTIGILTYHQVNFCKSKEAVANMNKIIEALEKIDQEQCGDCISREAVMHILDEVGGDFDSPREAVVPIDYIADMVSDLPSVTPQPCGDAISRQAVLEVIRKCHCEEWVKAYIGAPIEALQSVTPQQKMGRWIYTGDHLTDGMLKCSECGFEHDVSERFLYCPNCGRKMQEVK